MNLVKRLISLQENKDVVLGRMLEVLDEVDIETIPPYMLTSNVFCLYPLYNIYLDVDEFAASFVSSPF